MKQGYVDSMHTFIPDDLDRKFREGVFKKYGMKKGNITKALQEAMTMWLNNLQ